MVSRVPDQSLPPAVFVFDPASGALVSQSTSAVELLEKFGGVSAECFTLSTVEKALTAGSKMSVLPNTAGSVQEVNYELRRRCRRVDGRELTLTRIWAPGANTILIATDVTPSVQENRRLRLAQMAVDRIMRSATFDASLHALLRVICLYTSWPHAEVWVPHGASLVRRSHRTRKGAYVASRQRETEIPALQRDARDGGSVGEAWRTGEVVCRAGTKGKVVDAGDGGAPPGGALALPLWANNEIVAVLAFETNRILPRDRLALEVLRGVADRVGLALKCRINAELEAGACRRLDELLATAGDAIVTTDSSQTIRIFNKQAERVFGYEATEIIGRPLAVLLPESARSRHKAHIARFGKDGPSTMLMAARPEVKGRRKDGSEFPAEASVSRMTIENEVSYTAVVRDLTALRQAEDALHARERQLRMIVEAMPFGIAIARLTDGEILFSNGSFSELVETALPEVVGRNIAEFFDAGLFEKLSGGVTADGRTDGIETPVRKDSGNITWCALSAVLMSLAGESVVLIGCYDVTDRHRAVAALRESAHNLAEAERIAHLGGWIWDIASNTLQWSDEAYRIFGLEPQSIEMSYPVFLEHVHVDDRAEVEQAVTYALETLEPYGIEHRVVLPDGSIRFVREQAEIECDAGGKPTRMRGTVLDTTTINHVTEELREACSRAELANQSKSQFLANMSHELRTPLNAIIGFSELMASDVLGPMEVGQYRIYAKDINDSGNHLLAVINDILDLSRIEIGVTELDETVLDLAELFDACIRTVEGRAAQSGLLLGGLIPSGFPGLFADARLLKQILLNLLSNAIKFTPAAGTVSLSARMDVGGGIALRVEDNGIGIDAADIERVMDPFVQVEGSLSRRFDGVGLGLALVRQFSTLHDATLALDSEPGRGTCVEVRFPASRTRQAMGIAGQRPARVG